MGPCQEVSRKMKFKKKKGAELMDLKASKIQAAYHFLDGIV